MHAREECQWKWKGGRSVFCGTVKEKWDFPWKKCWFSRLPTVKGTLGDSQCDQDTEGRHGRRLEGKVAASTSPKSMLKSSVFILRPVGSVWGGLRGSRFEQKTLWRPSWFCRESFLQLWLARYPSEIIPTHTQAEGCFHTYIGIRCRPPAQRKPNMAVDGGNARLVLFSLLLVKRKTQLKENGSLFHCHHEKETI